MRSYLDRVFPFWQKALPLGCLAIGLILVGDRTTLTNSPQWPVSQWPVSLWIVLWGIVGLGLGLTLTSRRQFFTILLLVSLGLVALSYIDLLTVGQWFSLLPTLLSLVSTGLVATWVSASSKEALMQRRLAVEHTFDAVHNGPLQTLAVLYRQVQARELSLEAIASQLKTLDQALRVLCESADQQTALSQDIILLDKSTALDLNDPLSTVLLQVYEYTLSRPFPGFQSLRIFTIPNFSPLDVCSLNNSQKRGLCLFLEEALCNIGKYGHQVTYIHVICQHDSNEYAIEIINNILPSAQETFSAGYGTYQAIRLAEQLNGHFQRFLKPNNALHCQIKWAEPTTIFNRLKRWRKKIGR